MTVTADMLEKVKAELITLSQMDCLDSDYTADKMKAIFDTHFMRASIMTYRT